MFFTGTFFPLKFSRDNPLKQVSSLIFASVMLAMSLSDFLVIGYFCMLKIFKQDLFYFLQADGHYPMVDLW